MEETAVNVENKTISNVREQTVFAIKDNGELATGLMIRYEVDAEPNDDELFIGSSTEQKITVIFDCDIAEVNGWVTLGKISGEAKVATDLLEVIQNPLDLTKKIFKNKEFDKYGWLNFNAAEIKAKIEKSKQQVKDLQAKLASKGSGDIVDFLKRYRGKKHILIKGEKGIGKTYQVDKFVKAEGIKMIFIAGNEGLESIDLLGYYTKDASGNFVWLDGVLSQAFRIAADNEVVLVYDEILRTKARELNILVGALTPDSDGKYRLRTNRIVGVEEGVGSTEILEVPQENLWVIGTTNVGSKYNVEDIDDALNDRFRMFHKTATESEVKAIISYWINTKGFREDYIEKFFKLYESINELFGKGELYHQINVRHISETIQYAKTEKEFKLYLKDLIPNLCTVDMNGDINKTEYDIIMRVVGKLFS